MVKSVLTINVFMKFKDLFVKIKVTQIYSVQCNKFLSGIDCQVQKIAAIFWLIFVRTSFLQNLAIK